MAHGLKSGYNDFINWYWDNLRNELLSCGEPIYSDDVCSFKVKQFDSIQNVILRNSLYGNDGYSIASDIVDSPEQLESDVPELLLYISKNRSQRNWGGIEFDYYELLKQCVTQPNNHYDLSPKAINDQLDKIKLKLAEYLKSIIPDDLEPITDFKRIIYSPIRKEEIAIANLNDFESFLQTWANKDLQDARYDFIPYQLYNEQVLLSQLREYQRLCKERMEGVESSPMVHNGGENPYSFALPSEVLLLSFNYTDTAEFYSIKDQYGDVWKGNVIQIHNSLSNPEDMIFGYGDEHDEDYKKILNQNNNDFLINAKSVRYQESENYRNMLSFLESNKFQVFVLGHSCSTSDRTLLNTIFEHPNCVSIKPYYYRDKEGHDNYLEIVQNIYRNFTDMKLMRDRVVNKRFCEPLPQKDSK